MLKKRLIIILSAVILVSVISFIGIKMYANQKKSPIVMNFETKIAGNDGIYEIDETVLISSNELLYLSVSWEYVTKVPKSGYDIFSINTGRVSYEYDEYLYNVYCDDVLIKTNYSEERAKWKHHYYETSYDSSGVYLDLEKEGNYRVEAIVRVKINDKIKEYKEIKEFIVKYK